jgi:hypothetical protein
MIMKALLTMIVMAAGSIHQAAATHTCTDGYIEAGTAVVRFSSLVQCCQTVSECSGRHRGTGDRLSAPYIGPALINPRTPPLDY